MPIEGITDSKRIPRVGKVRLGIKVISKNTGKEHPKQTDYFVIDSPDENIMKAVKETYGDKPKELDIMLLSDDEEIVFPQYLKRYTYSIGCVCKGDGKVGFEIAEKVKKKGKEEYVFYDKPKKINCKTCPHQKGKYPKCKPMAHFMFMLPKIPGIGVWQLDTSSYYSITNINQGLKILKAFYKKFSCMKIKLILAPKVVMPKENGGRKKTVFVMNLNIDEPLLKGVTETARLGKSNNLTLPAPDDSGIAEHFNIEQEAEIVTEEAEPVEEVKAEVIPGSTSLPGKDITPEMIVDITKKKIGSSGKERVLARMQLHYKTQSFTKLTNPQKKELYEWIQDWSEVTK